MEPTKASEQRPIAAPAAQLVTRALAIATKASQASTNTSEPLPQSSNEMKRSADWRSKWLRLDPWHPDVEVLAEACERFCGRWYRNRDCSRLLVVSGQTGRGKTHAMRGVYRFARLAAEPAAANAFYDWPPTVLWSDWPDLARRICERDAPMWDVLYDSNEAGLLLLDDIGAESDKYKTGEAADALCQMLSRRAGKWTMVTTNIDPLSWATRFDVRVADRLNRDSEIVRMSTGGSYSMRAA